MNQKSIFETTVSRCGTHWVKYIIKETLGFNVELPNVHSFVKPRGRIEEYPVAIAKKETLDPGGYIYTYHVPLKHLRPIEGLVNILVVVRDPRDVCVSSAFYDIMKGNIPKDAFDASLQERLAMGGINADLIPSYLELKDSMEHYLIRFEDMILNPLSQISSMLDHFGYIYDKSSLEKALRNNTFKKLSGGREIGETNEKHHYRKGIVGDWRNYLSEKDNRMFIKKHSDIMHVWGYQ